MRIVIFTSNAIRHKYLANTIADNVDKALIVAECKTSDAAKEQNTDITTLQGEHFYLRYKAEQEIFKGNDFFKHPVLPLLKKEANLSYTYNVVKEFKPDLMLCFGASIIKEPLLFLLAPGHFVNLHLGLSPYYRGSGTNFFPFVNNELQYVGSTLLHIDAGIDTGDIICHVRPEYEASDTVHTVGCKVIKNSVEAIVKLIRHAENGGKLNRVKQWKTDEERYYKSKDFTDETLAEYKANLENGMIEKYIGSNKEAPRLITLKEALDNN